MTKEEYQESQRKLIVLRDKALMDIDDLKKEIEYYEQLIHTTNSLIGRPNESSNSL